MISPIDLNRNIHPIHADESKVSEPQATCHEEISDEGGRERQGQIVSVDEEEYLLFLPWSLSKKFAIGVTDC